MKHFLQLAASLALILISATHHSADAAELTFQLINDTERAMNMKLFSRGESLQQWPSKTKAYSMRPGNDVQQVKITCEEGEQICWGAWMSTQTVSGEITGASGQRSTVNNSVHLGVGDRGQRSCESCCQVCKAESLAPTVKMSEQMDVTKKTPGNSPGTFQMQR